MRSIASLACVGALVLGATAWAAPPLPLAPPAAEGVSPARLASVADFVKSLATSGGYLGVVSLVARNGRIVAWQAFGYRDLARVHAMKPDAIFRIYSMTKPVVSVAVLICMEEGRIASLDDALGKYLHEFAGRPVTIRHLLTHTSGLAGATEALENSAGLKAYGEGAARLPPAGEPGKRFDYNAVNTELASRLVEVVSGSTFDAFLHERIFAPLRMEDTGFTVPEGKAGRLAEMTSTDKDGKLASHPLPRGREGDAMRPYFSGAGGLYSTAGDYARFCQMLLNGGELDGVSIVGRKSVEMMTMDHLAHFDPPVKREGGAEGFGLGGYVVLDAAGRGRPGSVGAFGWSGAGGTYFVIDPRERLIAILMTQHIGAGLPLDPQKPSARFYNLVYQSLVKR
jgi:CubicO group peptidase (beta-lactamase class C family)